VEIGSFASGLVTGLREGVEAALVVSIILTYLVRTGHRDRTARVWLGVGLAVAASAAIGLGLFATVGDFREPYEQLFSAATMLVAASVVTWMLFWMRRQAASVSRELRAAVDRAIAGGGGWALAALAFVAVIREGVETSLFLVGQANAVSADGGGAIGVLIGAVIGLAIAAALGVGFYHGTRRIDLARFFRWTGIALILIAAGLVASAIHELVEIGVITVGTAPAFDLSGILPGSEDGGSLLGMVLGALFGYRDAPEVIAVLAWAGYVMVALTMFLRPVAKPSQSTEPAPAGRPAPAEPAHPAASAMPMAIRAEVAAPPTRRGSEGGR
jgi:high-affinity iron transporter